VKLLYKTKYFIKTENHQMRKIVTRIGVMPARSQDIIFGTGMFDDKMQIIERSAQRYYESCLNSEGFSVPRPDLKLKSEINIKDREKATKDFDKTFKENEDIEKNKAKIKAEFEKQEAEAIIKKAEIENLSPGETFDMITRVLESSFSPHLYDQIITEMKKDPKLKDMSGRIEKDFKNKYNNSLAIILAKSALESSDNFVNNLKKSRSIAFSFLKRGRKATIDKVKEEEKKEEKNSQEAIDDYKTYQKFNENYDKIRDNTDKLIIETPEEIKKIMEQVNAIQKLCGEQYGEIIESWDYGYDIGVLEDDPKDAGETTLNGLMKNINSAVDKLNRFIDKNIKIKGMGILGGSFLARSFGDMINLYKNVGKSLIKGDVKGIAKAYWENAKQLPKSLLASAKDIPSEVGMLLDGDVKGIAKSEFKQATGGKSINKKQCKEMEEMFIGLPNQIQGGSVTHDTLNDMISSFRKMGQHIIKGNYHKLPDLWMNVMNKHISQTKGAGIGSLIAKLENTEILPAEILRQIKSKNLGTKDQILNFIKDPIQHKITKLILGGMDEEGSVKIGTPSKDKAGEITIDGLDETDDIIKYMPKKKKSDFCRAKRDAIIATAKRELLINPNKNIEDLQREIMENLFRQRVE